MSTIKLHIENAYEDGWESEHDVEVEAPATAEDVEDWWEETVFNETGDGHGGPGTKLGSCYTATVTEAPADAFVSVGDTQEWC